ncbi:MAG: DUF6348 family protein [Armatimonas sp.]
MTTHYELQRQLEQSLLERVTESGCSAFVDDDGVIHTRLADARIVAVLLEKPASVPCDITLVQFTVYFTWNSTVHVVEHIEVGLSGGEQGIAACAHNFTVLVWLALRALFLETPPEEAVGVFPISLMTQSKGNGATITWKGYLSMQLAALQKPEVGIMHQTFEVLLQDHVANAGASAAALGTGLHSVYLFTSKQPDGSSQTECKIDNIDWPQAAGDLSHFRWGTQSPFQMLKAFFVIFPAEENTEAMKHHLTEHAGKAERQPRWRFPWQRPR